jgi:hypothetical protein
VQMPEASEHVGSAPLRALRAVFSGIGQMLLAADRLRAEDAREQSRAPEPPASPRPWGVSVTPSVRVIPADGSASDVGDETRSAASAASAASAGTGAEPARKEPPRKTRLVGKPKAAGKPSSSSTQSRTKTGSSVTPGAAAKSASGKSSGRASRKAPSPPSRFRSLDSTGNVRMLSAEDIAEMTPDAKPQVSGRAEPGRSITGTRPDSSWTGYSMPDYPSPSGESYGTGAQADPVAAAAESATSFAELTTVLNKAHFAPAKAGVGTDAGAGAGAVESVELLIAGYDELSLPSLRARLRNLDVGQLQVIVDYERSHANRSDIVTMFERRIAKLSDGSA